MAIRRNSKNDNTKEIIKDFINVKYNPYTYEFKILETSLMINDQSRVKAIMKKNEKKPLYFWYKDFITAISEDLNSKCFKIIFNGRNDEFADIADEVSYLNSKGWNIQANLVPCEDNKNILGDLENFIEKVKVSAPEELKNTLVEKNAIEIFENTKSNEAEVSVIATMSSGKSTLLNAILGKEVLPSKNEACTATICRIKDVKGENDYKYRVETLNGKLLSDWKPVDVEAMEKYNDQGNTEGINIFVEGEIPGIKSEEMNLVLIDTPGPNNSQNIEHKEATYKFIKDTKNNPLVLYVMNATQAGTNDDARLLTEISDIIKQNGKQAEERFIFALNKIDCFDPEKESIEILVENCKRYLKSFGIENPKLFPISAEAAKLYRLKQTRQVLSRKQKKDLENFIYAFLPEEAEDYEGIDTIKYASLPENLKERLYAEARTSEEKAALNYFGITAIELYIDKYVNKYAKTQKVKDSISTLKEVIDAAYNKYNLSAGKTSEQIEKIIKEIESIQEVLETSGKQKIKEVENKIKNLQLDNKAYADLFKRIENEFKKIEARLSTSEKITEEKARLIMKEVSKDIEELCLNISTTAKQKGAEDVEKKAIEIVSLLEQYFIGMLEDINMSVDLENVLKSDIKLEMPRVSTMIDNATYTTKEYAGQRYVKTVSRSTWWKPWTWGDEEDIYEDIYEDRKYVDLSKIRDLYLSEQKYSSREFIQNQQQELALVIDNIKEQSLKNINKVKTIIESKIEELKSNLQMQEKLASEKQNYELQMEIVKEYKQELDKILEGGNNE